MNSLKNVCNKQNGFTRLTEPSHTFDESIDEDSLTAVLLATLHRFGAMTDYVKVQCLGKGRLMIVHRSSQYTITRALTKDRGSMGRRYVGSVCATSRKHDP